MSDLIKWVLGVLIFVGLVTGMTYKVMHPTPYKHPLYQH